MSERKTERTFFEKIPDRLRKTSLVLILRFVLVAAMTFPIWMWSLMKSVWRWYLWRNADRPRQFLRRNHLAFRLTSSFNLEVEFLRGGISNLSAIWKIKDEGQDYKYYAKLFLPLGTYWAFASPFVCPTPKVYGSGTRSRFVTDMVVRGQLADLEVPVPKLVTYDPIVNIMVTEFIEGKPLSEYMKAADKRGVFNREDQVMLTRTAEAMAKAHAGGFSLIDIQPNNCLWHEEEKKVYFIDLEFVTREDYRTWDVACFLCFLAAILSRELFDHAQFIFFCQYQTYHQLSLGSVEEVRQDLLKYVPIFETLVDVRELSPQELVDQVVKSFSNK